MRFHADLVAMKFGIPTLALSYDPKVESLAKDANIPFVNINSFTYDEINLKIQHLIDQKDEIRKNLKDFAEKSRWKLDKHRLID